MTKEYQLLHARNGPDYQRFKLFREMDGNKANEIQSHKAGRSCMKVESITHLNGALIERIAKNNEVGALGLRNHVIKSPAANRGFLRGQRKERFLCAESSSHPVYNPGGNPGLQLPRN